MTLKVIYVTRHGFRSNWVVNPSNGDYTATLRSPTGNPADPALTAHGISQANELAERLLVVEPPIERVYSSMYYRCLQTVEPFVRKARAPNTTATGGSSAPLRIRGETGLGEWYGSAEFAHPTPASLETLRPLFPDLLEPDYRPAVTPNRMGEGINELHDRVAAAVDAVIAECDRDGVRAVLLCTHAAVIIALGRVLTGEMPDDVEVEDFRAFTCGLSLYRRRRQQVSVTETSPLGWRGGRGIRGGWDCELNSDCTHLSLGEERGWKFSGDESFETTANGPSMLDAGTRAREMLEVNNDSTSRSGSVRGKL